MRVSLRCMIGEKSVGEYVNGIARVDICKDSHNPGSTLVHEVLHHLYPEMVESTVLKWERKVWRKLRREEKLAIYRQMFNGKASLVVKLTKAIVEK